MKGKEMLATFRSEMTSRCLIYCFHNMNLVDKERKRLKHRGGIPGTCSRPSSDSDGLRNFWWITPIPWACFPMHKARQNDTQPQTCYEVGSSDSSEVGPWCLSSECKWESEKSHSHTGNFLYTKLSVNGTLTLVMVTLEMGIIYLCNAFWDPFNAEGYRSIKYLRLNFYTSLLGTEKHCFIL